MRRPVTKGRMPPPPRTDGVGKPRMPIVPPRSRASAPAMARPVTKRPPPPSSFGTGKPRMPRFGKGGATNNKATFPDLTGDGKVTRADILKGRGVLKKEKGGIVEEGKLDDSLEDFANKARARSQEKFKSVKPTKKSDLPMVDQYEVDRKMGRFSGSYKEYLDAKEAKPFRKGGSAMKKPPGLYANIHAKKKRIAAGSGEKMRKVGSKGAPTKAAFIKSAKTAKKEK